MFLKKVKVKSIANITGGGLTENIPRSIPNTLSSEIYLKNWKMVIYILKLPGCNLVMISIVTVYGCTIV